MNKLRSNLFTKKLWGSEVIWTLTDNYMAKTVEVVKGKQTPLVVHEEKEKSIIVINGPLYLTYGECCNEEIIPTYKLPEGWSWYIDPGMIYRYQAMESPVMLIEVSTPQFDDSMVFIDEGGIKIAPTITDIKELDQQAEKEEVELKKPKKRKRRVKNK